MVRGSLFVLAIIVLAGVYLFQDTNWLGRGVSLFGGNPEGVHPYVYFIFNKTFRLILNDLACFMLIYVIFQERKYLTVAFWLFLLELFVVLPVYFIIKLSFEGDSEISSPLLSQIHRLIVNPILMVLLILGFFYQKYRRGS
jgi:exosortase F-associated protein